MAFFLTKDEKFQLTPEGEVKDNYCFRNFTVPTSVLSADDGALNEKDFARLKLFFENSASNKGHPEHYKVEEEKDKLGDNFNRNLDVTIAIFNSNGNNRDFIRVRDTDEDGVLKRLKSFLNKHKLQLKVVVSLHNFTAGNSRTVEHVVSMESSIEQISSPNGVQIYFSGYWDRSYWNPCHRCFHKGFITIQCFLHPGAFSVNIMLDQKNNSVNRKILEGEINSDVTIIAKNNAAIKCHKSFLSAQSTVFEAMFNGESFKESQTSTVEMSDMTEDGVAAFLSFLYLLEEDQANEDSGLALELLQAGHKYDISALKQSMTSILLNKPDDWYQPDAIMKLFLFARNVPQGNELKMQAIKIMKKNFDTLKKSGAYKQLFEENPDAAMEFCEHAFTV